jgi:single-strand DNA-binding protein
MSSLNEVKLIGNLGNDPEIRRTQQGTPVANMSIATSERWKDKQSGEDKEKTEWHRVVLWGKLAEIAEQYIKKGDKVFVCGQLETHKWTDKDGTEKYSTQVVLRGFDAKLIMLSGKKGDNKRPESSLQEDGGRPGVHKDMDDEIPF